MPVLQLWFPMLSTHLVHPTKSPMAHEHQCIAFHVELTLVGHVGVSSAIEFEHFVEQVAQ